MARRKQGSVLPIELALLEAIVDLGRREEPAYGIALARELAGGELTNLTAHGTLYKALARLTERGQLESSWEPAEQAEIERRPRRKLYRVTAAGAAAAQAARQSLSASNPGLALS